MNWWDWVDSENHREEKLEEKGHEGGLLLASSISVIDEQQSWLVSLLVAKTMKAVNVVSWLKAAVCHTPFFRSCPFWLAEFQWLFFYKEDENGR
jgi:hypothetical protein